MPTGVPAPAQLPSTVPELASRLRLSATRLVRRLRQEADPGVGTSALSALASVDRLGPLKLGELAEIERIKPPTMTGIAASLEEAGLISREVDAGDRRQVRVRATPAGQQLLQRNRTRKTAYLARRLGKLPAERLRTLEEAVGILEQLAEGEQ